NVPLRDIEGGHVGERTFEPVPHLNEHFPVLDEYEQNDAISTILLTNTPGFRDTTRVVLDGRIALHFRVNHNKHLIRGVPFKLGEIESQAYRRKGLSETSAPRCCTPARRR